MHDGIEGIEGLHGCADATERRELLARLFEGCRPRLRRVLEMRVDPRLKGRIDPSDVLQHAYLQASRRLDGFLREPRLPFFLWLRSMTLQALHGIHRKHLGAQARDVRREARSPCSAGAFSDSMAQFLVSKEPTPSEAALRAERHARVREALGALSPRDREIITLRIFESLTSQDAARVLGVREETARKRFSRAMARFRARAVEVC